MNFEFSITETVTEYAGKIDEIQYEFEEVTIDFLSNGITNKKERRSRLYNTMITRKQYNNLAKQSYYTLSFDDFLVVLRPFMMGFYHCDELKKAFQILDKNHSNSVDIRDLAKFLPIINVHTTLETLKSYFKKLDFNHDGKFTYDEFRSLILQGIGREIICTHI